jgi:DNA-directed RNA polymerase subunit RPC12/RpoP
MTEYQKVPVSFSCKECGTKLSWEDDSVDSTVIACKQCGKVFGTYADLRHTAVEGVKSRVESMIKDALKLR